MVIRWLDEYGGLLKSADPEAQVIEVLQRPYFAPNLRPVYLDRVWRIFAKAELVTIVERVTRMPRFHGRQVS
ncbi:MAG: hypothetical protein ACREFP_19065 [Acetobacteraceae bacterium]